MALKHVVVALALFPSSAWADCESEAGKARENVPCPVPFATQTGSGMCISTDWRLE
jgi:hypothetical protein